MFKLQYLNATYNLLNNFLIKKQSFHFFNFLTWYDHTRFKLKLEISLYKWRWLVISSIGSHTIVWKRFLFSKLYISQWVKRMAWSVISFWRGLSLVQVLTSYHIWKLKSHGVHNPPLWTMYAEKSSKCKGLICLWSKCANN